MVWYKFLVILKANHFSVWKIILLNSAFRTVSNIPIRLVLYLMCIIKLLIAIHNISLLAVGIIKWVIMSTHVVMLWICISILITGAISSENLNTIFKTRSWNNLCLNVFLRTKINPAVCYGILKYFNFKRWLISIY